MPKIIQNVREQLLIEAKKQVLERGYTNTTIRSVAKECGIGVGTVYNYFESKELLVVSFVFEDWKKYLLAMSKLPTDDGEVLLKGIYDSLRLFAQEYEKIFFDTDVKKIAAVGFLSKHKLLREQIASFILPLCIAKEVENPKYVSSFVAEAIISWSMETDDFRSLYTILEKIIK